MNPEITTKSWLDNVDAKINRYIQFVDSKLPKSKLKRGVSLGIIMVLGGVWWPFALDGILPTHWLADMHWWSIPTIVTMIAGGLATVIGGIAKISITIENEQ